MKYEGRLCFHRCRSGWGRGGGYPRPGRVLLSPPQPGVPFSPLPPSPPSSPARTRTVGRRGRHASCVHAGGLPCNQRFFTDVFQYKYDMNGGLFTEDGPLSKQHRNFHITNRNLDQRNTTHHLCESATLVVIIMFTSSP